MAVRELNIATIVLTQGSADAFVQNSVLTSLANSGYAWGLVRVRFELGNLATFMAATGADFEIQASLTRRSKTAVAQLSDVDTIWRFSRVKMLESAVGFGFFDPGGTIEFDPPIVLPEEVIYGQLDSTGSGIALTSTFRLEYELLKVTEVERLSILARSLTV